MDATMKYLSRETEDVATDNAEDEIMGRHSVYDATGSTDNLTVSDHYGMFANQRGALEYLHHDGEHFIETGLEVPTSPLLAAQSEELKGRKCLVLDLDETLVHSSFKFTPRADLIIPVEIEGRVLHVYVTKRPGVDEFLKAVSKIFEVVIFTASVAKYGGPLLDSLDVSNLVHHRLFRESCYNYNGNYIKNLSLLGRPLKDVIIIDNSPASYALQPQHAVPVSSWFSDIHDNELMDMVPFLQDLAHANTNDVSTILNVYIDAEERFDILEHS